MAPSSMSRLDERARGAGDAYRAAYALAMAHRQHMEALYRGLYDAVVDTLSGYFTRATERAEASEAPPAPARPHRQNAPD